MAVNSKDIHNLINIDLEGNFDLESFILSIKTKINNKLSALLIDQPAACATLQEALEYTILGEGKRLRPALLYSACEALVNAKPATRPVIKDYIINSDVDKLLLHSAVALELVHTYSLVHDDLPCMDDDDMRRNKPSCHKQFDEATALLVGDVLQTMAFELLSSSISSDPQVLSKQLKIVHLLSQAIGSQGMVGGQSLEFNYNYASLDDQQSKTGLGLKSFLQDQLDLLNTIHVLKTGKLITAALQIGATIADCTAEQFALITKLGENLGLIYQIKDDIADYNQDVNSNIDLDSEDLLYSSNYVYILGFSKTQDILKQAIAESFKILAAINASDSLLAELIIAIYQNEN